MTGQHKRILQTTVYKLDNLHKIQKILESYKLLKLIHEEIKNLNRSTMSKRFESVIKKLPTKKIPGPDGLTGESY